MATSAADDERARVAALVRRFGWNAPSFQVLEPGFRYFIADDDAAVAYVDTGRAWVALLSESTPRGGGGEALRLRRARRRSRRRRGAGGRVIRRRLGRP